jgi:hypothetical protein
MQRWKQFWCGLVHGHDNLTIFEINRMYPRCQSCGHESPGWTLDAAPPKRVTDDVREPELAGAAR